MTENNIYTIIADLLHKARGQVKSTVNTTMVHTYYEIGRIIVEEEQSGKERANYGTQLIKNLSIKLTNEFGKGFSKRNLDNMKKFYEIEAANNSWNIEELERQIDSALYERLALSRDKEEIKALSRKGQTIELYTRWNNPCGEIVKRINSFFGKSPETLKPILGELK